MHLVGNEGEILHLEQGGRVPMGGNSRDGLHRKLKDQADDDFGARAAAMIALIGCVVWTVALVSVSWQRKSPPQLQ